MDSQRLLLAPRSFIYAVDEARASCGFRVAFVNSTDATDATPKYFLNISDVSASRVMFTFLNCDPEDYAITHVYFDDGELMAIDVVMESANDSPATAHVGKVAARDGAACPAPELLHENLAVIFDLCDGIGMADIVCALSEERLKISLKAARQGSDVSKIFASEPVINLGNTLLQE